MTEHQPTDRRRRGVGRPLVVLTLVAAAALTVLAAARPWAYATGTGAGARTIDLALTGTDLARPAVALALVIGAAALALTLARRRSTRVVLAGIALAGLAVAGTSGAVLLDPVQAVRPMLAEQAGLTPASLDPAGIGVQVTVWPWFAAAGGVLAVVVAGIAWPAARGWGHSARFDAAAAGPSETPDPAGTWDALSEGQDPTR